MLVAKLDTKERMQDETSRVVPAGSPFLNPATAELPMINYWADHVSEGSKAYDIALDKIPKKDLKYLADEGNVVDEVVDQDPKIDQDPKKEEGSDDSSDDDTKGGTADDSDKTEPIANSGDDNGSEYKKEELEDMTEEVLKDILKDNNITFGHNSKKPALINKIITSL